MRKLAVIFWLACWLSLTLGQVQANDAGLLASNHPDRYIVKRGDTLWAIAEMFLNEPWRWPQVWHLNPEIKNPHLIYPGDVILLRMINGKPQLYLQRNGTVPDAYPGNRGSVVKLEPKIRSAPAQKAIPTIPLNVIGPFLRQSHVIDEHVLAHAPVIVAFDDEHLVVGEGNRLYAKGDFVAGEPTYVVFRRGQLYVHPITGEYLGLEAIVLGSAFLESDAQVGTLMITDSKEEIRLGDKLLSSDIKHLNPYFIPKLPEGGASGYIIAVLGGLTQIGQHQVVVLTGGADQPREEGDVLTVYQSNKDLPSRIKAAERYRAKTSRFEPEEEEILEFPQLDVGKVIVFRVFDKLSLGLVVRATRPIYLQDQVDSP